MKSLAIALLVALTTLGLAAGVHAQAPSSGSGAVSAPADDTKPRIDADRKDDAVSPDTAGGNRNDDVSALPRATSAEHTTIFGLTPTAAIVIAAGLLVVVILAIVAMTRSDDTYFEP
jgi:hypothetical protein